MSETWLKPSLSDQTVSLPGFQLFRCDRVSTANEKLLLAVVYRPPHCGYLTDFFNTFSNLSTSYKHTIIFGDFNANLLAENYDSDQIKDFINYSSFYLVPYAPTHHTPSFSTLLDLCIVDDTEKLIFYDQRDVYFLSSHDLIDITYSISVGKRDVRTITVRDYSNFDWNHFLTKLSSCDWSIFINSDEIDNKVARFNEYISNYYNKHAPLKTIHPKHLPALWITPEIRSCMNERNKQRRRWRRNKSDVNYNLYKRLRNQAQAMRLRNHVQNLVRTARNTYYLQIFKKEKDLSTIWGHLRHLGLVRAKSSGGCLAFPVEELNNFFVQNSGGSSVDTADLHQHLRTSMESVFDDMWKKAVVYPIPKINNPTALQHYRPIAIFPTLSKIMERTVCDQIQDYLEDNNLYDPYQLAYRRGHSTQTGVIRILDDMRFASDRRMITISVLLDLSKAFDRVHHSTLLKKLEDKKFSNLALHWINSYLEERQQRIVSPVSTLIFTK
ncbi:uncharacterized protein LOC109860911 [Pseudomyrmex gracilis]|uniref:uncharacterized protein LOC109860911 n=1 Tax=Pseudomyrmex gracilis TaxID=219809 RepID=UPI000995890C|nr:uncharacterized protein LOC109860911 [Pseudomyrmex gracilis]